jgi:hypothetical protein
MTLLSPCPDALLGRSSAPEIIKATTGAVVHQMPFVKPTYGWQPLLDWQPLPDGHPCAALIVNAADAGASVATALRLLFGSGTVRGRPAGQLDVGQDAALLQNGQDHAIDLGERAVIS